ncbi:hypothetical protein MiSe_66040 [Microseira wollei NIES-4236]|uniref:Uncharacterized protein n=2 Tax=Microseira wollei TaxID=467598 RepID=A0AAV3XL70_9CYAN|nr:hypothetical protein [Microseira wollei]GET41790.1 hypothetical protein MiSe_66040 [Microseira wollei NIES-4236]
MGFAYNFQPSQIVCLEHEGTCLYAEVIQIVESRQLCWARPLMLATAPLGVEPVPQPPTLYDLRQGADLLWPLSLFRTALDTEVIPLLAQLQASKAQSEGCQSAHRQLSHFVRQVWQAHPAKFSSNRRN